MERWNAVADGAQIKALFLRNEHPTFPAFFDRAYPLALSGGGASWVARNERGTVVGHQAVFPRLFWDTQRALRAAVFVDNLFDPIHRNFWSALTLCRRTLADLRESGGFDFAYTDPTIPSQVVLQASGFATVGTMQRFVLPLQPLYLGFYRGKSRAEALSVARIEGIRDAALAEAVQALQPSTHFRAKRSLELYATRLGGDTMPGWQWLLLRRERDRGGPVAGLALTTQQSGRPVLRVVDVLWDDARTSVMSVLHAVARTARADGLKTLSFTTLAESRLARSLRRCGFIARESGLPLVLYQLRPGSAIPPMQDWLITDFDSSAW